MDVLAIRAGRLFTPTEVIEDGTLLIEQGRIQGVGPRSGVVLPRNASELDVRPLTLAPGFLDVHIHGAGGHDVMEARVEALQAICRMAARHGTTALLATVMTAPPEQILRSLSVAARQTRAPWPAEAEPMAAVLGTHLEGPFINVARAGVHPPEWIVGPSIEQLQRFVDAADGTLRLLTLAPELEGALELIAWGRGAGLILSLGHTDATYEQACAAIERGASHAAHVFNAMRPFHHRETGVLGAVLDDPRVTAEVIADGVHVDAPAVRLLIRAKGPEAVLLVTDATAAAGMPDGIYRLGPLELEVRNGVCRDRTGRLAGSSLSMDRAVRFALRLGLPPTQVLAMATLNPARLLGISHHKGRLAPGADADLVFLDADWNVAGVMTNRMSRPVLFESVRMGAEWRTQQ
jgi:N-acetylglucosamine-6-phosphate deacetylase